MTYLLEDNPPLEFRGGTVKTDGFRGTPGKTTATCAMCRMPREVNEQHMCRGCAMNSAEAEACAEDLRHWERTEELFRAATALKSKVERLLEDCHAGKRNPARVTALRGAEIALREEIEQLHRSGGV